MTTKRTTAIVLIPVIVGIIISSGKEIRSWPPAGEFRFGSSEDKADTARRSRSQPKLEDNLFTSPKLCPTHNQRSFHIGVLVTKKKEEAGPRSGGRGKSEITSALRMCSNG